MNFNDAELEALQSDRVRIGVFFRLETDPVVRLWLGIGNIFASANVLDPSGAVYSGFGQLVGVPDFNQLINGAAERVEFTLSGVSGEVMQIAAESDADRVKGKRVSVGIGIFGADWRLLGAPHWLADYTADYLAIDQQVASPPDPIVRTISLSCGSLFTGRRRPSLSYYSDNDQQARFPGDLSCSHVGDYAHGYNKQWPTF